MEKSLKEGSLKAVLFVLLTVLVFLSLHYGSRKDELFALLSRIEGLGLIAPLLFMVLQASRPLTFLPGALITTSGGLLFGWGSGTLYSLLGTTAGACLAFWLSTRAMDGTLPRKTGALFEKAPLLKKCSSKFGVLLVSRLLPFVPYNLVNYAAPTLRAGFPTFLLATFIGLLPKMIFYSSVGSVLKPS